MGVEDVMRGVGITAAAWVVLVATTLPGAAQTAAAASPVVEQTSPVSAQTTPGAAEPAQASGASADQNPQPMVMAMPMTMSASGWHFMQDAVVFAMFNRQGGPRGGDEYTAPNWWMGMLSRGLGPSQLTVNTMFSLDPAALSIDGYREIFQVGETLNDEPLIDRQHPHDFFMQLAAVWRIPMGSRAGFTVAGGPSGEPALGPVAFMHRASASENPMAPLSHHTFDSSHIAISA